MAGILGARALYRYIRTAKGGALLGSERHIRLGFDSGQFTA